MKTVMLTLLTLLLVAVIAAATTIGFGLFNVSARGGHWPLVSEVLHTTYRNSVRLRAPTQSSVPELDDEAMAILGARHYDQACVQCHGVPGESQSRTMLSMLPAPPPIRQAVKNWQPNHLFWIIKHGIKMSGMPHWPARVVDDDIWPVVAFLTRVQSLDESGYRQWVQGHPAGDGMPTREDSLATESCSVCHGIDGSSDNPYIPRLDILSESYLNESLLAYREQQRHSGIMQQAASTLDDASIAQLASHYANADTALDVPTSSADESVSSSDRAAISRGEALAQGLKGESGFISPGTSLSDGNRDSSPACIACHGPWPAPINARYPALAGQPEAFLRTQLQRWKQGTRGGSDLARMMHAVIPDVKDSHLDDLAAYYAHLPPEHAPQH